MKIAIVPLKYYKDRFLLALLFHLTHLALVPHMSQGTNTDILSNGPLETNFSEISMAILTISLKKMLLKMSSMKLRRFCLGGWVGVGGGGGLLPADVVHCIFVCIQGHFQQLVAFDRVNRMVLKQVETTIFARLGWKRIYQDPPNYSFLTHI